MASRASFGEYQLFTLPSSRGGLVETPTSFFSQSIGPEAGSFATGAGVRVTASIGFNFTFNNVVYDKVSIHNAGYFELIQTGGDTPPATSLNNTYDAINDAPLFAVWWDDITTSPTRDDPYGGVWILTGTLLGQNFQRATIIRWHTRSSFGMEPGSAASTIGPHLLKFEAVIYSGSGIVEYRYAPYTLHTASATAAGDASVGVVFGDSASDKRRRDYYGTGYPLGGSNTSNNNALAVYAHWPHLTGSHLQPRRYVFSPPIDR